MKEDLALPVAAPQHEPAPRPLPLFLELVRRHAEVDPVAAARALQGLRIYQNAPRTDERRARDILTQVEGACLRDCGGRGPPIVLVPSLINPPHVLDLDEATSLAGALAGVGHVLLLDWGSASRRSELDVERHITDLLLPLVGRLNEPPVLIGYCLGGTMALAAAALTRVRAVATLASPWHFNAYPHSARSALQRIWWDARPAACQLGVLPVEVLQAAFWSLDPQAVVTKYARLSQVARDSAELRRFLSLEDWANSGEPLPLLAARELIEDLFGQDLAGSGRWMKGLPDCPVVHFVARHDRIAPAETAAPGKRLACPSGHVGMVVGRSAPEHLHAPLREWLARLPERG